MPHLVIPLIRTARFLWNEGMTVPGGCYLLAHVLDRIGWLAPAARLYAAALRLADRSRSRRMFKVRQKWQFQLEYAHARLGKPRVEDPLFRCRIRPDPGARHSLRGKLAAGAFSPFWFFRGLVVEGCLRPSVGQRVVRIFLDDQLLCETKPELLGGIFPFFQVVLQRSVIARFPRTGSLRVELADGAPLHFDRCGWAQVEVPHGDGAIASLGPMPVNKKGFLRTHEHAGTSRQCFMQTYQLASTFFQEKLGTPLFLLYGTLLGCHRNGDLIPGDDDFDVGYVSAMSRPEEVKQEAIEIALALVAAGFVVSFNRNGRLFRLRLPGARPDQHLDVHAVWFERGRAWIHPQARIACTRMDFLPAAVARLGDATVAVPSRPEAFLETYYGPGWRVPDPSYSTRSRKVAPGTRRHLARACVTPAEFQAMRRRLARAEGVGGAGKLISVGTHSLYPLDDYDTNCDW